MLLLLVLARNDVTPTSKDTDTARDFFATVVSLQKPLDLLRFPLDHSLGFLKAKMRKVAAINMGIVDKFLDMYAFASFATEFKKIAGLAEKLKRRWDLSDPHQLVRHTFIEMIATTTDLSRTDALIDHKAFVKFLIYPVFLSYCGFYSLRSCQSDRTSRDMMEKYKRRIAKLERYHEGAYLIHEARLHHWPQNTVIPHIWISGPSILDIDVGPSPLAAASNIFPTITEDKLVRANPTIIQHWKSNVQSFVHPELHLILHLDMQTPSSLRSQFLLDQTQMRCIGLSRQSCQCCAKWIDRWNDRRSTQWITSGQNGMGFRTWKLTYSDRFYIIYHKIQNDFV
jgi:OTT_1508-like deaminase